MVAFCTIRHAKLEFLQYSLRFPAENWWKLSQNKYICFDVYNFIPILSLSTWRFIQFLARQAPVSSNSLNSLSTIQVRSIPWSTLLGALSLWLPLSAGWYFWTSSLFWHHKHKLLQSFQSARRLELLETESSDCGSRLAANQWQSFGKWSTSGLSWIIKASKWALNLRRCYKSGPLGLFKTLKSKLSNQYSFCFEYVPSWSRNAKIINNRALLKL